MDPFQTYISTAPAAPRVQPPRKALSYKANFSRHLGTHLASKPPRAILHKYLKHSPYQYFLHEKPTRIRFSPTKVKIIKKHTAPEIIIIKNKTNDGCRAVHTLSTREKSFFLNPKPILGTLLFFDAADGYAHQIGYMLKKYDDHVDCIMLDTHDSYNGDIWSRALLKMLTKLCKKPAILHKKKMGAGDIQKRDSKFGNGYGLCFQWSVFMLKYLSRLDPALSTEEVVNYVKRLYKTIFSNLRYRDGIHYMMSEVYGS